MCLVEGSGVEAEDAGLMTMTLCECCPALRLSRAIVAYESNLLRHLSTVVRSPAGPARRRQ